MRDWNDMERIWQYVYSKDQLQTFSEEVWRPPLPHARVLLAVPLSSVSLLAGLPHFPSAFLEGLLPFPVCLGAHAYPVAARQNLPKRAGSPEE